MPITQAQAKKLADWLADELIDADIPSELFQQVLDRQDGMLVGELLQVVDKFAAMQQATLPYTVKVNRKLSLQDMLRATQRKLHINFDVVPTAPRGEGAKATVFFFSPGRCLRDDDVEKEYRFWGLRPADLDSLAAVNEANPGFADRRPNSTWWKGKTGWCYARFDVGHNKRRVLVGRSYDLQPSDMYYAGMLPV